MRAKITDDMKEEKVIRVGIFEGRYSWIFGIVIGSITGVVLTLLNSPKGGMTVIYVLALLLLIGIWYYISGKFWVSGLSIFVFLIAVGDLDKWIVFSLVLTGAIVFSMWMKLTMEENKLSDLRTSFELPIIFYIVSMFFSLINAPRADKSFLVLVPILGGVLLFYCTFALIKDIHQCYRLCYLLVILAGITVILALFEFFHPNKLIESFMKLVMQHDADNALHAIHSQRKLGFTWDHPRRYAIFLSMIAPIAFGLASAGRKVSSRKFFWVLFALLFLGLILTNTRAPFVAFGIGILILIFFVKKRRAFLTVFFLILIAFVCVWLLAPTSQSLTATGEGRNVFIRLLMKKHLDLASVHFRLMTTQSALALAKDSPLIGVGVGNYEVVAIPKFGLMYGMIPHNFIMQTVAETGILGLLALLYLMYRFYKNDLNLLSTTRDRRVKIFIACLSVSSLVLVISSLGDNTFYCYPAMFLFWIERGLLSAIFRKRLFLKEVSF